jgi:hypothetical protein
MTYKYYVSKFSLKEISISDIAIIYRHMSHSLSEYISATSFAVRSPEEMAEITAWLYNNKKDWDDISKFITYEYCIKTH